MMTIIIYQRLTYLSRNFWISNCTFPNINNILPTKDQIIRKNVINKGLLCFGYFNLKSKNMYILVTKKERNC